MKVAIVGTGYAGLLKEGVNNLPDFIQKQPALRRFATCTEFSRSINPGNVRR